MSDPRDKWRTDTRMATELSSDEWHQFLHDHYVMAEGSADDDEEG